MTLPTIAILDDYQEFSKAPFERLRSSGYQVTTFKDTLLPYNHPDTPQDAKDALVNRLEPFNIICSMRERTPFPAELTNRLPNLKLLLTTGPRNAAIDVQALQARGIPVAGSSGSGGGRGTPSGPDSTTQHTVALILALARNIPQDDATVKSGGWQTKDAIGLAGKIFGTVGLGRLGATTSRIMHLAFGMRVIAWSTNLTQDAADEKAKAMGLPIEDETGAKTFKVVARDELFSTADVVSIHLVLSERSRGLVGMGDLGKMKKSALLVNTSRGPIANEAELLEAGKRGLIRGIGLDVYGLEPLPQDSEWRSTKWGEEGRSSVVLTPHMGYVEAEPITAWYGEQVENILRWQKGEALTTLFKDNGY
ncbi:D-isomer specific 2-hydroxyacid dehydrogenase [Xylaria bambusicola]|uniref:D-isomer specific 2-hydroxyacid dehydrogenase n=1 Tax=Xylaria bambusicola TaxID=326684 RepID=UPI002008AA85|nr:D-isomer specific 2-hydroxyacid dehydrogenase [Xylaria bambusicola]KAI0509122.1 D-isomer specific 2-hydroxyacid dehydrogenase [Xylaria bambusicola]